MSPNKVPPRLTGGEMLPSQAIGQLQKKASHLSRVGKAVSLLVGQNVPDRDQQLAGDSDQGLGLTQAGFEPGQFSPPVGVNPNRGMGGLNHSGPDVAPSGLGDGAGAPGLTTVIDPSAQPSIADQKLGSRKALNVANRGQQGDRADQPRCRATAPARPPAHRPPPRP